MQLEVEIRAAGLHDAIGLADAWLEFGREYAAIDPLQFRVPDSDGLVGWLEIQLQEELGADAMWLVAERGGRIIGDVAARVWRPSDDGHRQIMREMGETVLKVDSLMVREDERRAGVATALMKAAEAWGKERGASQSVLISYAHSPTSVPFYERGMGYERKTIGFWKPL